MLRKISVLVAVGLIGLGCSDSGPAAPDPIVEKPPVVDPAVPSLSAQVTDLQNQIATLNGQIADGKKGEQDTAALQAQLAAQTEQLTTLQQQLDALKNPPPPPPAAAKFLWPIGDLYVGEHVSMTSMADVPALSSGTAIVHARKILPDVQSLFAADASCLAVCDEGYLPIGHSAQKFAEKLPDNLPPQLLCQRVPHLALSDDLGQSPSQAGAIQPARVWCQGKDVGGKEGSASIDSGILNANASCTADSFIRGIRMGRSQAGETKGMTAATELTCGDVLFANAPVTVAIDTGLASVDLIGSVSCPGSADAASAMQVLGGGQVTARELVGFFRASAQLYALCQDYVYKPMITGEAQLPVKAGPRVVGGAGTAGPLKPGMFDPKKPVKNPGPAALDPHGLAPIQKAPNAF